MVRKLTAKEVEVSHLLPSHRHLAASFISRPLTGVASAILGLFLTGSIAWSAVDSQDSSVPTISAVLNNYSYILPSDKTDYGIAPGSIFVIFGTGMATPGAPAALQDSTKGLPKTLNGASLAVTVAGLTVQPAFYYATPTQIAAVLPSNTLLGTGTVTVIYNNVSSVPFTFPVVQSAMGFATMSGDGTGPAMATDANYNFITPTNSAAAGQYITLWGTGLGASTADSDTTYTPTPHQITSIPLAMLVLASGDAPSIVWAGRSAYPGLDQINIQLPIGAIPDPNSIYPPWVQVPVGCSVPLMLADSGTGVGSNAVTVPIAVAGRACGQPSFVVDPSVAQALGSQATVKVGSLSISQSGVQAIAGGSFYSLPGATFAALAGTATGAAGSCVVVPPDASSQIGDLGAGGAVSVTGPSGPQPLTTGDLANYGGIVPTSTIPAAGAALKFVSGGGPGATIGAFTAGVNYPAPLEWTNQDSIGAINRSQGVQLTWTGGDVDGTVAIRGSSFAAAGSKTPNTSFMCSVPANAGQFTVPPAILQALPAGAGTLTLENQSAPQQLAASGLDIGYIFAGPRLTINTPYN